MAKQIHYQTRDELEAELKELKSKIREIYKQGVIDGFKESGEGWNWEYPFCNGEGMGDGEQYNEIINEVVERWEQK